MAVRILCCFFKKRYMAVKLSAVIQTILFMLDIFGYYSCMEAETHCITVPRRRGLGWSDS